MVQAFLKKWWVESDFKAPKLPLSLRLKVSGCHYNSFYYNTWTKQVKQLSKQHQTQWSKCQRHFYHTLIKKKFDIFVDTLSLYIYTLKWGGVWEEFKCSYIHVQQSIWYRRGIRQWTIQRNWQHILYKTNTNNVKTQHNMCWKPLCASKHE